MSASRAERVRVGAKAALGGLALALMAATALAQAGPPVRLTPPAVGNDKAPPSSRPTRAPGLAAPAAPPPSFVGPAVKVDELQGIDADSAGTLGDAQGGLGAQMWQGVPRRVVARLLPRLPVGTQSPAVRDLMRRLLLTSAAVPEGPAKGASLIATRVRLLAEMGDQAAVAALLEATPGRGNAPELLRLEADARFLSNDNARACAVAAGQVRASGDAYWQKAFAFCLALAGEGSQAQLTLSLLREMGENDPAFFQLMDRLTGAATQAPASLAKPTPLHLAMARAGNLTLPNDVVATANPGILRTISISPNASIEIRLESAERAEAAGALPTDALRQLYMGVSFSEQDLANPLSKAESDSGPMGRALLYRTAMLQKVPTAQAEAVSRALALARRGGRYPSAVRVFMPVIKRIPASTDLLWFAPEAARAALLVRDTDLARDWFAILRASALFNKDAAAALSGLMPLAQIAGSTEAQGFRSEDLAGWFERGQGRDGARAAAALLYALKEGLDQPVAPALWEPLLEEPERTTAPIPNPAIWFRLDSAAKAKRVGETVILALLALGESGLAETPPATLARVLGALGAVGLKAEARALALEAAVAAGL